MSEQARPIRATWDVFCRVVDNYGDIGVTWRLARQLVAEHGLGVRLWVDDLHAFARVCPLAQADVARQWQQGVEVCHWQGDWLPTPLADVVIEAFACRLPDDYIAAMAVALRPPLWLNLEYLSAEPWVDGCHGLRSPQPQGLQKWFFFPGFTPATGGLLREADLLEARDCFQADRAAQLAFLAELGVTVQDGAWLISLFAYENAALSSWLDALASGAQRIQLLVPEGRILADVQRWLGAEICADGNAHPRGSLTVQVLPFVSQEAYDRLLWCCDLNAVRGEDSFVRAQWAARPLLWHIYVQEESAHLEKLDAFLACYTEALAPPLAEALGDFSRAWNTGQNMAPGWETLGAHWPSLQLHARQWSAEKSAQTNLAAALVQFWVNWL